MLRAKAFSTILTATFLLAACGQLLGLGDYEAVEGDSDSGSSGKGGKGGGAGRGGSGGEAGAGTGGAGGMTEGGASGSDGMSGTSGSSGSAGIGGAAGMSGEGAGGAGDGGVPGAGGDAGSGVMGGEAGSGGEAGAEPCVPIEIELGPVVAFSLDTEIAQYYFAATPKSGEPQLGEIDPDFLVMEFYAFSGNNGAQKGTFDIGTPMDTQYLTCSRCLRLRQDFAMLSETTYLQSDGEMVVDAMSDQMNGDPIVSLSDVTFVETTIDFAEPDPTYVSTPVPGGACLHLAEHSFEVPDGPLWDLNNCQIQWLGDGLCDCGCGSFDPDCSSASVDACDDVCFCDAMTEVCNPDSNWLCDPITP
jgi:hypothetical protein